MKKYALDDQQIFMKKYLKQKSTIKKAPLE